MVETEPTTGDAALGERAAEALAERGWVALANAVPGELLEALTKELESRAANGELRAAAIGHRDMQQVTTAIRADRILWLQGQTSAQRAWLERMDAVRQWFNRTLYLGLQEFECHFAIYPPGAYYRKHYDRFRDDDARVVTAVLYLTPDWRGGDGGALRLYDRDDEQRIVSEITPEAGTLVFFLSGDFPHEVLLTQRERRSITGWFRRPTRSL